jgi:acetyl esterase
MILKLLRLWMAAIEWVLRHLVLNRNLPAVAAVSRDVPYGPHPKHRLDIYRPSGSGPHPTIGYVHGGGWVTGDKSNFAWICQSLAHHGHLVFSINYRPAPEAPFPEPAQDICAAMEWIERHADQYGADLQRLAIAGDSAGAHLSCWLVAASRNEGTLTRSGVLAPAILDRVRGLVLLYGIYDLPAALEMKHPIIGRAVRWLLCREGADLDEWVDLASPAFQLTDGMPACLVCAGERDPLYKQSTTLLNALKEHGVPHRAVLFSGDEHPEAGHSYINFGRRPCSQITLHEALAFLNHPDP